MTVELHQKIAPKETYQKAISYETRALLQLALLKTSDAKRIQDYFDRY